MDINRSSSSRFKVNKSITAAANRKTADASRINSASYSEHNNKAELKEGQLIRGEILDHRYNEVKVKLEPGNQVITARLSDGISLSIGQNASFIVSELDSEQLVLKLVPDEATANDSIILKALTAANVTITNRNKAIVAELLSHRMPVDKQTLQILIKLSGMNREASPLCLVLMHKNNIPVNSHNLKQFQAYLDGTHQLLNNIKDITQGISKLLINAANTELMNNNQPVPGINTPPQELTYNIYNPTSDVLLNDTATDSIITAKPIINSELGTPDKNNSTIINTKQSNTTQDNTDMIPYKSISVNDKLIYSVRLINDRLIDIFHSYAADADKVLPSGMKSLDNTVLSDSSLLAKTSEQQVLINASIPRLTDILNRSDIDALLKYLSHTPEINSMKESIANGTASLGETLTYIQNALPETSKTDIIKLITSPEYSKLLEKAFYKKWTLTPENVSNKHSVQNFYTQLDYDLREINKLANSIAEADDYASIQKPLNTLQDNMQFMKELNNAFSFLQLPLGFKDREVHTDLYVLNRKKALNDKNQSLNVHLHLETANLGSLNIHLQMISKRIETVFYPESIDVAQIIKENLPLLISSLQTKGYNVKADVTDTFEQSSLFKQLIEQSTQDNIVTRYTFDIRT